MDTQPFEYKTVRGRLSPLTNRSEMMVTRMVRVLSEAYPDLLSAAAESKSLYGSDVNIQLWRFTNLSRIAEVEGLGWPLPGPYASKDEILAAWECYLQDKPGFWEYLGQRVIAMDEPETPLEARPEHTLTDEQRKDPNLPSADGGTAGRDTRRSRKSSVGANRPNADTSTTTTPGTPSSVST